MQADAFSHPEVVLEACGVVCLLPGAGLYAALLGVVIRTACFKVNGPAFRHKVADTDKAARVRGNRKALFRGRVRLFPETRAVNFGACRKAVAACEREETRFLIVRADAGEEEKDVRKGDVRHVDVNGTGTRADQRQRRRNRQPLVVVAEGETQKVTRTYMKTFREVPAREPRIPHEGFKLVVRI